MEEKKISQPDSDAKDTSQLNTASGKSSRWKKILLRISAIVGLFFLLLWIALIVITVAFGDQVKEFAISAINKQLATEVKVSGPISFSVFSRFPYASVCFEQVDVVETLPEKNNFLSCRKISLLFNLKDLWNKNYVIKKITADDGIVKLHIDSKGNKNFDIFKKDTSASVSNFSLTIKSAELNHFNVTYLDESNEQEYSFKTEHALLEGDFSAAKFTMNIDAKALSNFLKSRGIDYLPERTLLVKGAVDCDLEQNKYSFRNVTANVNGNNFNVDGTVAVLDDGNNLQLKIHGKDLSIPEMISLLPAQYSQKLTSLKYSGELDFSGEISGVQSTSSTLLIKADFGIKDGSIGNDDFNQIFSHMVLKGSYTNGSQHTQQSSALDIKTFSADVAGNKVNGSFILRNFLYPSVDAMVDGLVDLEKVYSLFKTEEVKSLAGEVAFHDCYYRGELSALRSSSFNINKIQAGGKFELKDLKVEAQEVTYDNLNGAFEIKNNDIIFSNCAFTAASSDLRFDGTVSNFFPFLFSVLTDSTRVRQKIGLNATLASDKLVWEDLMGKVTSSNNSTNDYSIPGIFYRLSGSVSGSVNIFSYQKFNAQEIHGKILFLPGVIYFNDIGLRAEDGVVTANGKLDISRSTRSSLNVTIRLQQLNLTKLFYECNNFNQTTLTDRHLKGTVTSNISLQSVWDNNKLNLEALHAVADVTVENGELNNFEPMMALATFVKLKELRNIQFSKLQNEIEIKNRHVYIPATDIYSSAINVHLSGSHGFDNIIDYKVQLNLLRLLTDKFRKSSRAVNESEQTTEGFLNLFLTMTGPASDPVIKYDKQSVKQKIATDLAEEKQNLKEILKKEFNQQDASQEQAKDWKPQQQLQYFEFENDSIESSEDDQQQAQKKSSGSLKNLFKKDPDKN